MISFSIPLLFNFRKIYFCSSLKCIIHVTSFRSLSILLWHVIFFLNKGTCQGNLENWKSLYRTSSQDDLTKILDNLINCNSRNSYYSQGFLTSFFSANVHSNFQPAKKRIYVVKFTNYKRPWLWWRYHLFESKKYLDGIWYLYADGIYTCISILVITSNWRRIFAIKHFQF